MNSDDKSDVVMAFQNNALVYWSDLKNLIGVYLSASTAAFAPLLLSDPPRVFSPTHKRTEGRAPVWGSEFTSKRRRTTGGIQQKPL